MFCHGIHYIRLRAHFAKRRPDESRPRLLAAHFKIYYHTHFEALAWLYDTPEDDFVEIIDVLR